MNTSSFEFFGFSFNPAREKQIETAVKEKFDEFSSVIIHSSKIECSYPRIRVHYDKDTRQKVLELLQTLNFSGQVLELVEVKYVTIP